jgi:hypothetical protein
MKSDDACLRYNVRKYANTASKLGLTLEQTYAFLKASFDHESWFYNISALELEKQVLQTVLRGMMDAGYDLRRTGDKHV